ncbi:hypothetical protein [Pantoea agglomerans]|uniref:hypothetical protein n=1 Tax=Enterobacter agglomerans TaxID=549 RepID=UPI00384C4536
MYYTQTNFNSAQLYSTTKGRKKKINKAPEPYSIDMQYQAAKPLTKTETDLIAAIMAASPGVTYKPRDVAVTVVNGVPEKWQALGFGSELEYYTRFNLQADTTHYNGYELQLAVFGEEIND